MRAASNSFCLFSSSNFFLASRSFCLYFSTCFFFSSSLCLFISSPLRAASNSFCLFSSSAFFLFSSSFCFFSIFFLASSNSFFLAASNSRCFFSTAFFAASNSFFLAASNSRCFFSTAFFAASNFLFFCSSLAFFSRIILGGMSFIFSFFFSVGGDKSLLSDSGFSIMIVLTEFDSWEITEFELIKKKIKKTLKANLIKFLPFLIVIFYHLFSQLSNIFVAYNEKF